MPRAFHFDSPPAVEPQNVEHGHLTWLRFSAGDRTYSVWRCRCGNECSKVTRDVRKAAAAGRKPMCDACMAKAKGKVTT